MDKKENTKKFVDRVLRGVGSVRCDGYYDDCVYYYVDAVGDKVVFYGSCGYYAEEIATEYLGNIDIEYCRLLLKQTTVSCHL